MNDVTYERLAELRLLAHIARNRNLHGAAFRAHIQFHHERTGIELSAVARVLIANLRPDLISQDVSDLFDQCADELEAQWSRPA